jgi:hypothetical protein
MRLKYKPQVHEIYRTMDGSDSIGVYGEAKAEYTRQLCSFLVPALETYFLDLLAEVKANEKDPKRFLWVFQDSLKQFPDWNIDKVQRETEKIQTAAHCDYLEEILTAVFIAHTKVLSAIRLTSRQKKLQITIPKIDHFLHRTMSECARLLWANAYLFSDIGSSIERQKNLRQVSQLLHEGVLQSIRGMLPVKSILKEYLSDDTDDITTEQNGEKEEETNPVIHEEELQDLSGTQIPAETPAIEQETATAPDVPLVATSDAAADATPAPVPVALAVADAAPAPVPVPDAAPAPAPAANAAPAPSVPTIIVDTEPPSVGFTHMDAVLDSENPDKSTIQISNQINIDDEDNRQVTHIEVDDSVEPESVEEYESLEIGDETFAVDEDEFESL